MVSINGHDLHVETHGPSDGPVVVLLHHGLGSVSAWRAQVHALAATGWRVVAYDRWGYGGSERRAALSVPYFEDDIADLGALLEAMRVERACLVGHSDGGTIALYFAAAHPERVRRLVTVAAHIYVESPKMDASVEVIRQSFESDRRFREALKRAHGANGETTFWNWYRGWMRPENLGWDMRPVLRQIACPALVVQGLEDEHATPQHARDIAEAIPNAELWLAPDTRHMLPQEIPEAFNQRLVAFLGREMQS